MTKKPFDLRVVLVRTIYERNVGAASRAMANMGIKNLILIDPKCEITLEAHQAAANGQQGLQNRLVYPGWKEFYANEPTSLRLSMTARDGRGRAARDLATVLAELNSSSPFFDNSLAPDNSETLSSEAVVVHLIFGPEDWGLSAEDIEFTNFCCSIPTYGDNTSLNLAQAVLLALFIVRQAWGGEKTKLEGQQPERKKSVNSEAFPAVFPEETLRAWLQEMGFDLGARKMNVYKVIKRMLLQNTPTPKEYLMLETVLQQSLRKLTEYNQLRKENL